MEIEQMLSRLLKGEDVKKIVNERLEYLRSEEYQKSKSHIISTISIDKRFESNQINHGMLAK